MKQKLALLIMAGALLAQLSGVNANTTSAEPESASLNADMLTKGQQIASTICVACHGLDGNSTLSANPNIAGMPAQYITKQLENFKNGTRQNPIMLGMVASLAPEQMKAVGLYYFSQKSKTLALAKDKALADKGQKIYRAGIPALQIPACAGCHGGAGAGIPANYPRLSGQWPEYTLAQLKSYANGQRKSVPMNTITSRMREEDMQAVAEYLAGMRSK